MRNKELFLSIFLSIFTLTTPLYSLDNGKILSNKGLYMHEFSCTDSLLSLIENRSQLLNINSQNWQEVINSLDSYLDTFSNPECKSLGNMYIANYLFNQYNEEYSIINERTPVIGCVPADRNIWSANLFFDHIFRALQDAVKDSKYLSSIPLNTASAFVEGDVSLMELTLFDFIAHNVLEIISQINTDRISLYFPKELPKMEDAFLPADEFIAFPFTGNAENVNLFQIRLFQEILKQSIDQKNSQWIRKDLLRLKFLSQCYTSEGSSDLYQKRLEELLVESENKESVLLVALQLFTFLNNKNQNSEIGNSLQWEYKRELLIRVESLLKAYPNSPGNCELRNLASQIRAVQIQASLSNLLPSDKPICIRIKTQNVKMVKLSILNKQGNKVWQKQISLGKEILSLNDTIVTIPPLPFGSYTLKLDDSQHPGTSDETDFIVSNLFSITQKIKNQNQILVLNMQTGIPVENAFVKLKWKFSKYQDKDSLLLSTNRDGIVQLPTELTESIYYQVSKGNDCFQEPSYLINHPNIHAIKGQNKLSFFLDKPLYRPGQMVRFKAIAWTATTDSVTARVGEQIEVTLLNANLEKILTKSFQTDCFGAISGEFNLPLDLLDGTFRLSTSLDSQNFEVAQYKRPTFTVTLNPVGQSYALGDSLSIDGNVKTFSGVSVEDAEINYSITYEESFGGTRQLTASGTITSDSVGNFVINFPTSYPDKNDRSVYGRYVVSVLITNRNGETHAAERFITIGNSSIDIEITKPEESVSVEGIPFPELSTGISQLEEPENEFLYLNKDSISELNFKIVNLEGVVLPLVGMCSIREKKASARELFRNQFISDKPITIPFREYPSGIYDLILTATDPTGKNVKKRKTLLLYTLNDPKPPIHLANWFVQPALNCKAGNNIELIIGSSASVSVLEQIFNGNEPISSRRFNINDENKKILIPYKREYGSSVSALYTYVLNGIIYKNQLQVRKEKPSCKLTIRTDIFRDKLQPGEKEEWRFTVLDTAGNGVEAQILADLYEASLDQIREQKWMFNPSDTSPWLPDAWKGNPKQDKQLSAYWVDYNLCIRNSALWLKYADNGIRMYDYPTDIEYVVDDIQQEESSMLPRPAKKDLSRPAMMEPIRTNFNETAFFQPKLLSDNKGHFSLSFTMPEILTEWRLRMLATTPDMHWGLLNRRIVTVKQLMVTPNFPRFVRQGDSLSIPVQILNQTDESQTCETTLEVFDPDNSDVILKKEKITVDIPKKGFRFLNFRLNIPENISLLVIRVKGANNHFSDGEQQLITILPSQTLVNQTFVMNLTGKEKKTFRFNKFLENKSRTATDYRYTVEFSGNPAFYAVQALPSVSNLTPDNAALAIASYYVNQLASHIADSNPAIREVIEAWAKIHENQPVTPLEKHGSLKQFLLKQTPWMLHALNQTEQMQELALLFDKNRIKKMSSEALSILNSLQNTDGGFSWYKGMESGLFQTFNILEAFARLKSMNVTGYSQRVKEMQIEAVKFCDREIEKNYRNKLLATPKDEVIPSWENLLWIYIRSSYRDIPFTNGSLDIHEKYLNYMKCNWKSFNLYQMAMTSLALRRYGFISEADQVLAELRRLQTKSPELGTYWANNRSSYFYQVSALQCHVMLMTAFQEGNTSNAEINNMKLWLLKQKHVQGWGNYPATVDAIYGILMRGSNWLEFSKAPVIKVGSYTLRPNAWLGFADTTFNMDAIKSTLGIIRIHQKTDQPGYGAAYWQYFEKLDLIKESGNGLKISKQLFVKQAGSGTDILKPIDGPLKTGDRVVTRLIVQADRAFSYITLRDQRAACLEPVDQLSGYFYNQGIGYYQETEDATTSFFFTYLPEGTYVFEYDSYVDRLGVYQNGISTLQSLYAPEFIANTGSSQILVSDSF